MAKIAWVYYWVYVHSKLNEEKTCTYCKCRIRPHRYLRTVMRTFFLTTWPLHCVLFETCTRKMNSIFFTWLCILFRICRGWKIWMSHRVDGVRRWNAWISWVMRHVGCPICHRWRDTPHRRHNRQGRLLLTMTLCSLWPHDSWCITAK